MPHGVQLRFQPMASVMITLLVSIATLSVLVLYARREKLLSRRLCLTVVLSSCLCSALAHGWHFWRSELAQRISAARLVGVTKLRIRDDAILLLDKSFLDTANDETDWVGTFKMKSDGINVTLSSIEGNNYLIAYYSVWMSDVTFRRDQIWRLSQRVQQAPKGAARETSLESYLVALNELQTFLERFSRDLRT